jgi:hypothetical protein
MWLARQNPSTAEIPLVKGDPASRKPDKVLAQTFDTERLSLLFAPMGEGDAPGTRARSLLYPGLAAPKTQHATTAIDQP